jgi:hypothetical protein
MLQYKIAEKFKIILRCLCPIKFTWALKSSLNTKILPNLVTLAASSEGTD